MLGCTDSSMLHWRTVDRPHNLLMVRASARVRETGFDPRPRHTKDVKTGRFALLSLVLGSNELGNRLAGSESV